MRKLLAVAMVLCIPGIASAASLVQNGSFEDPTQASGTWDIYPSIPGWTSGSLGIEVRNNVVGTASAGSNFVELDTTANSFMSQSIATQSGQRYTLSFDYSPRIDQPAATNGIGVQWNGNTLATFTANGGSSNFWATFTFIVTGAGTDVLRFFASGTSDSLGGNIDNVSLAAVPLPGAAILFGSVLLGAGVVRSRMTRSALPA